jgi:hypothetical protein
VHLINFSYNTEKKGSNWSAIVRGGLPQVQPQPVVQQQPAAAKAQSRPNQKKKADNQTNGHQGTFLRCIVMPYNPSILLEILGDFLVYYLRHRSFTITKFLTNPNFNS